jgi:anti-sigma28 factor (negative regulator of flagellin synthesis)
MKINQVQIDKLYGAMMAQNLATTQKEAKKQAGVDKDNLVLSSTAKGYSELDGVVNMVVSEATKATPAQRLLLLKNEIARGNYHVSAEQIAEAMLYGVEPKEQENL